MIGLPPSLGAVQLTIAAFESSWAETPVGVDGGTGASGVTELDCADSGPAPVWFEARTVNVYAVPAVSPLIVVLVAGGEPLTVLLFAVCGVEPM